MILDAINLLKESKAGEQNEQCLDLLRRFLESNIPAHGESFNLYNYTAKGGVKTEFTGVYHENGFRIASDGFIIIIALAGQDYKSEYEGKILDSEMKEIKSSYPKWQRVIPEKDKMTRSVLLDYDKISDLIKQNKRIKKETPKSEDFHPIIVSFGGVGFDINLLFKIAVFAKYKNELELHLSDEHSPACIYCSDGSIGLIMPKSFTEDYPNLIKL